MMAPETYSLNLSLEYGPPLIATFVATALWGISCVQTIIYFETYRSDGWRLKTFVILLWLLDTVHEILCIQGLWAAVISNFDGFQRHQEIPAGITQWQVFVTGIVATIAHGFFTWRIWRFANKKWIFPIILVPLTLAQMVISIMILKYYLIEDKGSGNVYILVLGAILTCTDVLIASIMCILLRQGRTGLKSTDRMILRLVNAAVGTGVFTAVLALFAVLMSAIRPLNRTCFIGEIPLCAMYCNAVLANLNSRRYFQRPILDVDLSLDQVSTGSVMQIASSSNFAISPQDMHETPHEAGIMDSEHQPTRHSFVAQTL